MSVKMIAPRTEDSRRIAGDSERFQGQARVRSERVCEGQVRKAEVVQLFVGRFEGVK